MWVACTNRDTMKLAARLGLGALTFAFMDGNEAKFWVEEYYEIFKRECTPIGQSVNPNIAMLMGLMVHPDSATAHARGDEGQRFFAYGLAHYYRFGSHRPGRTNLWEEFKQAPDFPMAGHAGIGSPDEVRDAFGKFEEAGVDQLIVLQQAARYPHEHICESLELFGDQVLPAFIEREQVRQREKMIELAPYIEQAMQRIPPIEQGEVPVVDSYPKFWEKNKLIDTSTLSPRRQVGAEAMWRMMIGGVNRR